MRRSHKGQEIPELGLLGIWGGLTDHLSDFVENCPRVRSCARILFVTFALFQVPANIILDRVGARRWMFCILAVWGAISAANALIRGPASFYLLRLLLGAAEAGFVPGILLYLSYWFPQSFISRFTAMFMAASVFSLAIGGPLASVILGLDGILGELANSVHS